MQAHTFPPALCLRASSGCEVQDNLRPHMAAAHWHPAAWSQRQAAPETPASSLLRFLEKQLKRVTINRKPKLKIK